MGANSIIVKEYLESLKEDRELDYLFPLLLSVMGFDVITTAKESKGQAQYGKDVVAIGKDEGGKEWKYYFQIKAGSAKDINDSTFNEENGIRSSLLQAKDTPLNDSTRPDFASLPLKVVLVHPGTLKENFRPTFEGFIQREFKDGEFEHWHIYKLISLFEENLFNECLLIDGESYKLFKRLLVLLDAPGNDFRDLNLLLDHIVKNHASKTGRKFQKFFASFHLIGAVIFQYSKEANNLHPAKECLTILILKVWSWILSEKLETDTKTRDEFGKLLGLHFAALDEYFKKTLPFALSEDGLFAERSRFYEAIGYPLRSFEYLSYLLYYCEASLYYISADVNTTEQQLKEVKLEQKELLCRLLPANDGCSRPVMDYHSIPISVLFIIFTKQSCIGSHLDFIAHYLESVFNNILIIKSSRGRFPLVGTNINILAEYSAEGERPEEYFDDSSILIPTLFELLAVLGWEKAYDFYKDKFKDGLSMQIPHPREEDYDFEQKLFEGHQHDGYYVETLAQEIPQTLDAAREKIIKEPGQNIEFRTDKAGFPFLRLLAHLYHKNELPPYAWRSLLQPK